MMTLFCPEVRMSVVSLSHVLICNGRGANKWLTGCHVDSCDVACWFDCWWSDALNEHVRLHLSLIGSMVIQPNYSCQHNCAVERALAVGFCGQLHHCNWPYYLAAWFPSPFLVMVSAEPFSDRSRPMPYNLSQTGPCQITNMWLWPAADYEPYRRRVSIDKVRWRTTSTSWSWSWHSQVARVCTESTAFAKWNENSCFWILHFCYYYHSWYS